MASTKCYSVDSILQKRALAKNSLENGLGDPGSAATMTDMTSPTPEEVREALAGFDARQQKIVAGLLTVMIKSPQRVREREWMAQQLTELTVLAGEFDADTPQDGVEAVHEFLQDHSEELVRGALLLFQRVGLDMAPHVSKGFTFEEALRCGLGYLPG